MDNIMNLQNGDFLINNSSFIKFDLAFIKFKRLENWDEISFKSAFHNPCNGYIDEWPQGIEVNLIQMMIPCLLNQFSAQNDSELDVEVLDYIMVFRVKICGIDTMSPEMRKNEVFILDAKINFGKIAIILNNQKASSNLSHIRNNDHQQLLECTNESFQIIKDNINSRMENPSIVPLLFQSFLITGSKGAGKSIFLRHCQEYAESTHTFQCLYLSCNNICIDSTDALKIVTRWINNANNYLDRHNLLLESLKLLSKLTQNSLHLDFENINILLLFDNVEDLLFAIPKSCGMVDHIPSQNNLIPTDTELALALLLKLLLDLTREDSTSTVNLVIVGAADISIQHIPQSNTGAPSFQRILSIVKPTVSDREYVIKQQLSKYILSTESAASLNVSHNFVFSEVDSYENIGHIWAPRIASLCPGFLPGDIMRIFKRLDALQAAEENTLNLDRSNSHNNDNIIMWSQMLAAIALVRPQQIENIKEFVRSDDNNSSPEKLGMDDFAGYAGLKIQVSKLLRQITKSKPNKQGQPTLSAANRQNCGVVINGASGNGKSYLAQVLSQATNSRFLAVRCTEMLSKYFGETEANIRAVFANAVAPCLLFFDEFDVFAHKRRDDDESNGLSNRILSTFLNELDGTMSKSGDGEGGITVMVACTSLADLDDALLRPGRLSLHLKINNPDIDDIRAIIAYKLKCLPISADFNLDEIVNNLVPWRPTCADVVYICKEAIMNAVRLELLQKSNGTNDSRNKDHQDIKHDDVQLITTENFKSAIREVYGEMPVFSIGTKFDFGR